MDAGIALNQCAPFIQHWAHKLQGNGVDTEDLVSEGVMGSLLAMNEFDPSRNLKFVTFAKFYIKARMFLAISNMGRPVRIPDWVFRAIGKGTYDGETKSYVFNQPASFDDCVGEDGLTLADILADGSEHPCNTLDTKNLHQLVREAIAGLPEKERSLIHDRFMLGETIQDIADRQGVTPAAIRKREKKAIKKLRHILAPINQ